MELGNDNDDYSKSPQGCFYIQKEEVVNAGEYSGQCKAVSTGGGLHVQASTGGSGEVAGKRWYTVCGDVMRQSRQCGVMR